MGTEYIVKDFSISKTKKGDPMGNLTLENTETKEILNCKIWDNIMQNIPAKSFVAGNTVTIAGEYNSEYKNFIIKDIKVLKEASIGLNEHQREELFNKINDIIAQFKDEKLKNAVKKHISENEEAFKLAPAAKFMHHNYIGGLMQHIWECLEIAKAIIPTAYKNINSEIIYAGCIMHDVGKIFEYDIDLETGLADYNADFKKDWVSHTQYGFCWAMSNDFKQLAKIIASHHSRKDWGAIIDLNEKDLEPEMYLLHHIDDLSAKFGKIDVFDIENI